MSCWRTLRTLSTTKLNGHIGGSSSTSSASSGSFSSPISYLISAKVSVSLHLPPLVDNSASISNKTAAFSSVKIPSENLSRCLSMESSSSSAE